MTWVQRDERYSRGAAYPSFSSCYLQQQSLCTGARCPVHAKDGAESGALDRAASWATAKGYSCPSAYVLLASVDAWRTGGGDSATGGPRRSLNRPALYAFQSQGGRECDSLTRRACPGVGSGELTKRIRCERKSPCVYRGKMVEAASTIYNGPTYSHGVQPCSSKIR